MRRAAALLDVLVDPPPEGSSLTSKLASVPLQLWLLLAGVTFSMFSGWSQYLGLPISLDRIFVPAALVLTLLDQRRPHQRMTLLHWLMAATVVWILVDTILWDNVNGTSMFALLDRVVLPFAMLLVASMVFTTPFRRRVLLVWLTALGAYLGATALAETFAPSLVFPHYITFDWLGLHPGRARGPMMAADAMGMAAGILGAVALTLAVRSRGALRWGAAAVAMLSVAAVGLSLTRATWLGAGAAAIVVLVLVPAARRWIPGVLAGAAAATIAVITLLPQVVEMITARFGAAEPVYDRLGSNDAAVAVIGDLPLTGIGWRRFYPHGAEWFRQSDQYPTNAVVIEIHNVLLSRAAELGLVMAAVFVLILALGPGRHLWCPVPPATLAVEPDLADWRVLGAVTFTIWIVTGMFGPNATPLPNLLTFLVCGVAAGYLLTRSAEPEGLS